MHKDLSFFLTVLTLLAFSSITQSRTTQRDDVEHFNGYAEPVQLGLEEGQNPLDYSSEQLGVDFRNFELPRGWEGSYRFGCRFPIIDFVSNDPLYMKQWTEETAEKFSSHHCEDKLSAFREALTILRGTDKFKSTLEINQAELSTLKQKLENQPLSQQYREALLELLVVFYTANDLVKQGLEGLTAEDLKFFRSNPGYFLIPDGNRMTSLTGNLDLQHKFIPYARRVRYDPIFHAAYLMSQAIDAYISTTSKLKSADIFEENASGYRFTFDSEFGTIIIDNRAESVHEEDAALIIDLTGDDIYLNNAGSGSEGCCLVIDHNGNDVYSNPERLYVQGFGFLGNGFLVDLRGNDHYEGKHFCQGAGIMGTGLLYDAHGDDEYSGHGFVQGAGMFGLGMVIDDLGEDYYDCATMGQGAATTLGLGTLIDRDGDDRYHLWIDRTKDNLGSSGYGQGGGVSFRHFPWRGKMTNYGGVGFLYDEAGNDRYRTNGWCDQGGSYIMSLGALYDACGNDHYTANTGQGSGIHITNAILIDRDGHDIYEGGFRCGGSGGDRTPGILIDYAGNDRYISSRANYGTGVKPFSFSLFIDYAGDDYYFSNRPKAEILFNDWESFGCVWPESESYLWPYGMHFDLGGNDDYHVKRHANNTERYSFAHGIHLDMEWSRGDVIGEVNNPLPMVTEFELPQSVRESDYYTDIKALQSKDTFERFQAVGRLAAADEHVIQYLVLSILASENRQFNRDALECIHYHAAGGRITAKGVEWMVKLLASSDPEVRIIAADNCNVWNLESAEDALLDAIDDPNDQVRRYALSALSSIDSDEGIKGAETLVFDDSSEDVRRAACYYLLNRRSELDLYDTLIQILQSDPATSVRVAAIDGLRVIEDKRAVKVLRNAADTHDAYIQRAAGRALAELYQVDGIKLLIESLDFPSIDAFFNYNRNVPNSISTYAGHDFEGDDRYDQKKWLKWFEANKDSIDIEQNVNSYRDYRRLQAELRGLSDSLQIVRTEEFLAKYPDHSRAKGDLATLLNRLAWYMVTDAKGTPDWNPALAVKYARRAVELVAEINYIDTLAEAYLQDGKVDMAVEICERYPGNAMFEERLKRCREKK